MMRGHPSEMTVNLTVAQVTAEGVTVMPLTDVAIRNAKPAEKDYQLRDSGGLYVIIKTTSARWWRLDYRHLGTRKTLSLGTYPITTLSDARFQRDEAKRLLAQGIDPSLHRRQSKAVSKEAAANSFEFIAREWLAKKTSTWSAGTAIRMVRSFDADLFPYLGKRPITEITAPELLTVLRKIENRGAVETAHRVKQRAGEVFRYAIATGRAERDPTPDLRGALPPVKDNNFAAIKEPKRIGDLLRAIDNYQGTAVVKAALRLAPLVFVRPGNLRQAEWKEFDLVAATWRIPAEKMKSGDPHIVPLSRQALEILQEIRLLTGQHLERQPYVFPSARGGGRPMSDNAILVALRTMEIGKEEMTGHGFRHMASTMLHEQGWNSDVIERQLAHGERNKVKAAYNHAKHLPERVRMMQTWADYLDSLRAGAVVIPITRTASI
jgi:integrase